MANVRCRDHSDHLVQHARTHAYVARVRPVGYPNTSTICGIAGCTKPGLVHLNEEEWVRYHTGGERVFDLFETNAVKLRVGETYEEIE